MADFSSILNKKASEIEKPLPKPPGTYLGMVVGLPNQRTVNTKDGERLILSHRLKAMAPMEDVDRDLLSDPKVGDIQTWPSFSKDFWVDSPEGENQYKEFLVNILGIDPGPPDNSKTLGEMAAETPSKQLVFELKHRPFTDKNTNEPGIATDVGTLAKA